MVMKKRPRKPTLAKTDSLLKASLIDALRNDAHYARNQTYMLGKILGELSLIRALLEREAIEREAIKYNLLALAKKPARKVKRKAIK